MGILKGSLQRKHTIQTPQLTLMIFTHRKLFITQFKTVHKLAPSCMKKLINSSDEELCETFSVQKKNGNH